MSTVSRSFSRLRSSVQQYLFARSEGQVDSASWNEKNIRKEIEKGMDDRLGEVSARHHAARIGSNYVQMSEEEQLLFLSLLATDYGPDKAAIDAAIDRYQNSDETGQAAATAGLRKALDSRRKFLLTRFTSLPDGLKFLVDMREFLLKNLRQQPQLKSLDNELKTLFKLWFDPGFLTLQRVTWSSPACLLEKLMRYEANHSIVSWEDLKNRLDSDRRCYTLLHPSMPEEPLAILHVALQPGVTSNIQALLNVDAPPQNPLECNAAVFYSVTSPQEGLRGISFGEIIIKQAVAALKKELPGLKTFVTLSPIPGFRDWLADHLSVEEFNDLPFSLETMDDALRKLSVSSQPPEWEERLKTLLTGKCLQYLTTLHEGRSLNSVARFHLRNGAYIQQINFLGNTSDHGINSSASMMVNYGYNLRKIESNIQNLHRGKLPVAQALVKLARQQNLSAEHLSEV